MIYLVEIREYKNKEMWFVVYESNTSSYLVCDERGLKLLITNYSMTVVNATLNPNSGEIVLQTWCSRLHHIREGIGTGAHFILLCKLNRNKFRLANYKGLTCYMDGRKLSNYIKQKAIANCSIENEKLISFGTYNITKDIDFEAQIKDKYDRYVAKSTMLGKKMSFDYIIEGRMVKLVKYTGITKDVIIPKFVTTIMTSAFQKCGIETLIMDNGIKHIGDTAFQGCNLSEIVIPQTVEFMGSNVFYKNSKLLTQDGDYRDDRITIVNKNATIIDIARRKNEV